MTPTLGLVDRLLAMGRKNLELGLEADAFRLLTRLARLRDLPAAAAEETQQLAQIMEKAYRAFIDTDAMLVEINGAQRSQEFPVDGDIFHIGAAPDNNLIIKHDDYVSGYHALLCCKKGCLSIVDQHSKNGTFLNGNRLGDAPVTVNIGDRICMGQSIFEVARAESQNRRHAA